jgi:hypothetical protein
MEGESMTWIEITLFGLIVTYIIYLNRQLTLLKRDKTIGMIVLNNLEGLLNAKNKE